MKTQILVKAKTLKYGYAAFGVQSNSAFLSRAENLAKLAAKLGLSVKWFVID